VGIRSLQTQPLQAPAIRVLIRDSLALPGPPQMLLQLGVAWTTRPTGRRPAAELGGPAAHTPPPVTGPEPFEPAGGRS